MPHSRSSSPYHPRNWDQNLSIALLWLLARLPWRWAVALGAGIGRVTYFLASKRRYVVRRNLELCFPELSSQERERWVKANFAFTGRGMAEVALGWFGGPATDRIPCEIRGIEHVQSALDDGRPVILLSGHFCCIELVGRLIGTHVRMAVVYKPIRKKALLDAVMRTRRERNIGDAVSRDDVRGMLRHLKAHTPIWFAGDQHLRRAERVFAPFFGVPTATTTGLPRLAQLGKAKVVPAFYNVNSRGDGYQVTFGSPLEAYPSDDRLRDVTRMNQVIEDAVRANPTQYFWVHRRFKSQPEHAAGAYPRLKHSRR